MSWLTELMEMHSELESPKEFWRWAGLATLSAVAKDNIWVDRQAYKLYPNIYVMLHADSGLKKGPPVNLAKHLVKAVNSTKVITGRASIQGLMRKLGTAVSTPGGRIEAKSIGFYVASEFSSSLVNDPAAMTILTDLYDRNWNEGDWEHTLKMEEFRLIDPTLTMLVATNEAHFHDFIAAKDKKGGFMGRMFVIAESEVHRLQDLIDPLEHKIDRAKLLPYLKEVSKLRGAFKDMSGTPAGKLYKSWYTPFYTAVKEQGVKDETGTIQRLGDSVVKVAMLLSLAEDTSLEIKEHQMEAAITISERLIGNVRKTTMGKQAVEDSNTQRKDILIRELMARTPHTITRTMLSRKYWMHGNINQWDEAVLSLEVAGMLVIESPGNNITYTMPTDVFEKMERFFKGKNK